MTSAGRLGVLVVLTVPLWVGTACSTSTSKAAPSPTSSSTPSASPVAVPSDKLGAAVPMPIGFPSDFPTYPGARLTVAGQFTPDGTISWGLVWQTLDGPSKVQTFYIAKLKVGDWTLLTHTGTVNTSFSATFRRKSNSLVRGTLGVTASAGVTKISLVLTAFA